MDRPLILLTNDDGAHAAGIRALREAVQHLGEVVLVAPTYEQSGMSHAITIDRPLRHVDLGDGMHSIDGTPADCVYLALFESRFLGRRPDLVLSGINHGGNLGTGVFYSGTVAGAREAAMRGIPALALSMAQMDEPGSTVNVQAAAELSAELAERLLKATPEEGQATLLNVNFPAAPYAGVRVTQVGRQVYEENVIPRRDPGGREYFWIGGRPKDDGQVDNSDAKAIADGYVSVTPLQLEVTKTEHLSMAALVAGTEAS